MNLNILSTHLHGVNFCINIYAITPGRLADGAAEVLASVLLLIVVLLRLVTVAVLVVLVTVLSTVVGV